jgi:acyl-CoA dehydrogenase
MTPSAITDDERSAFRDTLRRFVDRELMPHIDAWEEAAEFPRDLYLRAGELGLLGMGFPEEYGGSPRRHRTTLIHLNEELARTGAGGLIAGLFSHGIGLPPIVNLGSDEQKRRYIPDVLAGHKISALAISEPSGGSDVANLRTTARRDGDHYVVHGSKMFITSGRARRRHHRRRTHRRPRPRRRLPARRRRRRPRPHPHPAQEDGLVVLRHRRPLLRRVPRPRRQPHRRGDHGFLGIMRNFNRERLMLAAMAVAFAQVCLDDALAYARERETFGKPLITRQVIRHKLVDMLTRIEPVRCWLYDLARRVDAGEWPIAQICMLKNAATACVEHCAREGVQILGGAGYMRGTRVERIYRETKVLTIGGGAEEIMKDLAARQLGW